MTNPNKKKFTRQSAVAYKRLAGRWRKPRGGHNKVRQFEKGKIKMPKIGYSAPKQLRFLHPSGLKEVLVFNTNNLSGIDPKTEAARISHSVSKRKKQEIVKKAEELKVKVLNP